MNILADASLPDLDAAFPAPFQITVYHNAEELKDKLKLQDVLLCRSYLKVNEDLIKNSNLKYVATASSGTDHIDRLATDKYNIEILDAKGCNAIAVADYVEACIAYLEQHSRVSGKQVGIIGLGKVGTEVQNRLLGLNFKTIVYDPLKASIDKTFQSCTKEDLLSCDLICIHAELHNNVPYPSLNLIDAEFLAQLKPNTVIINAARGGIVNEDALLTYDKPLVYCTDVFLGEPNISPAIIDKAFLCTPHIAGHSLEAKHSAVAIVSQKLHHLVGLAPPTLNQPVYQSKPGLDYLVTRQDKVLAIYDPSFETQELKIAGDKKAAFQTLRRLHHFRHDFNLYFS